MGANDKEIIVKRTGKKKKSAESKSKTENKIVSSSQMKITGILLFFLSILLFLALISYSSIDEQVLDISFGDLFGLIFGNPEIKAKADLAHNWLGLLGAFISDFFYNGTIGYAIFLLPYYLSTFSKNIFYGEPFKNNFTRKFLVYLILGSLFASIMGSLRNTSLFSSIPKEWSGTVGYFLSSVSGSFIGAIGSIMLFLALVVLTLALGTNIQIEHYFHKFMNWLDLMNEKASVAKENLTANSSKPTEESKEEVLSCVKPNDTIFEGPLITENTDIVEPARIIKKNLNPLKINSFDESDLLSKESIEKETPIRFINPVPRIDKKKNLLIDIQNLEPNDVPVQKFHYQEPLIEKPASEEYTEEYIEEDIPDFILKTEHPKNQSLVIDLPKRDDKNQNYDDIDINFGEQPVFPPLDRKPLVVTINEQEDYEEQEVMLRSPLSLHIHDEAINYKPPKLDFLAKDDESFHINEDELKLNARILQEKLETFKIYIDNLTATPGPVVTQYEFVPAAGIKISRIESLADDLAMALKAQGIRIIAPIPGKGTVGVEIPNSKRSMVKFSSLVKSSKFTSSECSLPLALGKTISGEVYIGDLAKLPHLLIGGSTGSGKSVGINTLICSLLYSKHPSELKFIMIDPKKVELPQYGKLREHFMARAPEVKDTIVTNPNDAVITLKSAVLEMERRYEILAHATQRNITDYNQKVKEGKYKDDPTMDHRPMPFIVIIIDELADLMLTASKEIEEPICRLAQMARAVGIHLVVATQRPSVDVITGLIKANFPARIAYLVSSKIDSRTIIDSSGADQLLGNGDLLFIPPGTSKPVRLQNSFINTDEVELITDFIGKQKGYSQPYILPSINEKNNGSSDDFDINDRDPLFEDAARLIIIHQQGSVSLLQRRLKVGYARAGRIIDELERAGVVGPHDGSKARAVLMESESELERIL